VALPNSVRFVYWVVEGVVDVLDLLLAQIVLEICKLYSPALDHWSLLFVKLSNKAG